jgi:hypothetical protein
VRKRNVHRKHARVEFTDLNACNLSVVYDHFKRSNRAATIKSWTTDDNFNQFCLSSRRLPENILMPQFDSIGVLPTDSCLEDTAFCKPVRIIRLCYRICFDWVDSFELNIRGLAAKEAVTFGLGCALCDSLQ